MQNLGINEWNQLTKESMQNIQSLVNISSLIVHEYENWTRHYAICLLSCL